MTLDDSDELPYKNFTAKQPFEIDTTTQEYLRQCVKEGFEILAKEEKAKIIPLSVDPNALRKRVEAELKKQDPSKELKQKLTADQTNPYVQARINVLLDINAMFKKEVLAMEASGDTDNRKYQEFIRMVREEGDKLSNNS
jgi:thiamine pyrophosphate-dependent acetolactate synthase large subunit-like protein